MMAKEGGLKMAEYITRAQYNDIESAVFLGNRKDFNARLQKHTRIVARPYTAYSYYDAAGNYLGDSNDTDLDGLLQAAYMEVKDD